MSVLYTSGDLLAQTDLIPVIPVNTVGVPGAGLAKAWADRYPQLAHHYRTGSIPDIGQPLLIADAVGAAILFATKRDWRDPSQLWFLERGLEALPSVTRHVEAKFGVPKLGCGLGGLDWEDVRPMIHRYLHEDRHSWYVFDESEAPK